MTEEKKPEEENETTSKTTEELVGAASTFIKYLKDEGFTIEESVGIFALANSLMQVELLMKTILKDAKIVAIPIPPPTFSQSDN